MNQPRHANFYPQYQSAITDALMQGYTLLDAVSSIPGAADLVNSIMQGEVVPNSELIIRALRDYGFPDDIIYTYALYPSRRPRTTMHFITQVYGAFPILESTEGFHIFHGQNALIDSDLRTITAIIDYPSLIPVTRYAGGMHKGMFHPVASEEGGYCGTFYYFEPSSDIYMRTETALLAPNRIVAAIRLGRSISSILDEYAPVVEMGEEYLGVHPHQLGIGLQRNLPQNDREAWTKVIYDMVAGRWDYDSDRPELSEDFLDQDLCIRARERGYDAIILSNNSGLNRVVSEVLDVRRREDSFHSLVRVIL